MSAAGDAVGQMAQDSCGAQTVRLGDGGAAGILRHLADSIARCRHTPRLLAMGDFNDEPHNASVSRVLAPTFAELTSHATPLPAEGHDDIEGSYYFRGEWSRIDQILVSPTLLSPTMKFHTTLQSVHLLAFPPFFSLLPAFRDESGRQTCNQ